MRAIVVLLLLVLMGEAAVQAGALPPYRAVAVSGQQVPGAEPGVTFRQLIEPVVNSAGQVAFGGLIAGAGVFGTNDSGIFSEGTGSLATVALEGTSVPGAGVGVVFGDFSQLGGPLLNAAGHTALYANLQGPGVTSATNAGVYLASGGTLAQVVREGQAVPGAGPGVVFSFLGVPVMNPTGQIAFQASMTGAGVGFGNDVAIYVHRSGALVEIAREGMPAPGADPGVLLGNPNTPVINPLGQIAFATGPTVGPRSVTSTSSGVGVYSDALGTLAQVAGRGGQPPHADPGVTFSGFGTPVINDAGKTAFRGTLQGTEVITANDTGIYLETAGTLLQVAREGQQPPSANSGAAFRSFSLPVLNSRGDVAFRGLLAGTDVTSASDSGIYLHSAGALHQVAREGDQAPGAAAGTQFSTLGEPTLNGVGQVAFQTGLIGSAVGSSNNLGIYATDRYGTLVEIVRKGQQLDVNNDPTITDLRTVLELSMVTGSGNADGRRSAFNDRGQLTFLAQFAGSAWGVFVSNRVAVPEPSTIVVFGAGGVVLFVLRRRMHRWCVE